MIIDAHTLEDRLRKVCHVCQFATRTYNAKHKCCLLPRVEGHPTRLQLIEGEPVTTSNTKSQGKKI